MSEAIVTHRCAKGEPFFLQIIMQNGKFGLNPAPDKIILGT